MKRVKCPGCGADNKFAYPAGTIRCINCGKEISPG